MKSLSSSLYGFNILYGKSQFQLRWNVQGRFRILFKFKVKYESLSHSVSVFDMTTTMIEMFLCRDVELSPVSVNHII